MKIITLFFALVCTAIGSAYAQECASPPSGLVAWWPANGDANDIIGSNNATLINGTGFTNGEAGLAFELNGANNYALINPATTNLTSGLGNGFTFEGWINPAFIPTTGSQDMIIFDYERVLGSLSGSDVGVSFAIHDSTPDGTGGGCLYANVKDTSGNDYAIASPADTLVAGAWQHIALSYDKASGTAAIYVNGSLVSQASVGSFSPATTFTNLLLGARTFFASASVPNNPFDGGIDEFSFYDRALTTNEIAAIYNAGSAGKCMTPMVPVVTKQPQNQTNSVGEDASFSVTASGTPTLSYQWRLAGTNLPAATNSSLTLSNLSLIQAGSYDVVVSNYVGSVTSSPAILDVLFIAVKVNGQFATGTVTAIATATVTLSGGYPSGFLFYTLDNSTPTSSSTYYSGPIILTNSAVVRALSLSADFSQSTEADPVTVQIIPTYNLQTSIIGNGTLGTNPPSGPYASNSVVTLTATAALHWAFDHWTGDASGSQNPLNLTMNGPLNVQAIFVQTAFPLTLTTPGGGGVTANGLVIAPATYYPTGSVISIAATANNGWSFLRWQGNATGTNSPLNLVINQTNNIQAIFGTVAATNSLGGGIILSQPNPIPYGTILAVSAVPDPGNYFVSWSGSVGGTNAPAKIVVTNANPFLSALFTRLPSGKYTLSVIVNGSGYVTNTPQRSYYNPGDTVTLRATNNGGAYFFGWTQDATGTNNPLTLLMNTNKTIQANFGVAPIASISPLNLAILAGSNAVLSANVLGLLPLSYQWQNSQGAIAGANGPILVFFNAQPTNAGTYSVVVSNSFGSVTSAVATVTVIGNPTITNQPPPFTTVTSGHAASFVVGAYGWPALAYQWQFDGVSIAGATNSTLTLQNVFPMDAGTYTVNITNVYGSVTSNPAMLMVLPLGITAPTKLPNGQFQFTFDTATGVQYLVEYSTNLTDWHPLMTVGGNGAPLTLTDPNTTGSLQRYYRIVQSSP